MRKEKLKWSITCNKWTNILNTFNSFHSVFYFDAICQVTKIDCWFSYMEITVRLKPEHITFRLLIKPISNVKGFKSPHKSSYVPLLKSSLICGHSANAFSSMKLNVALFSFQQWNALSTFIWSWWRFVFAPNDTLNPCHDLLSIALSFKCGKTAINRIVLLFKYS